MLTPLHRKCTVGLAILNLHGNLPLSPYPAFQRLNIHGLQPLIKSNTSVSVCECVLLHKKMSRGYKCNQQNLQQRSLFLPIMICSKPSIKDVRLSHRRSASLCDDPLSPRVGCTGQVMRNSKVIGFPTPNKLNFTSKSTKSSTDCNNFMKYQKLKKFFSSKSLINSPTSFAVAKAGASRTSKDDRNNDCFRGQRLVLGCANGSKFSTSDSCESNLINVADLDPPLPVTRRVRHPENGCGERENLWKRRSGGIALQSLQVKSIQSQ